MQTEAKRKFLVTNLSFLDGHQGFPIAQGYLWQDSPLVEVRTFGSFAFLIVHGMPEGSARKAFEYPIPLEDALAMLENHCTPRIVRKTRHLVPHGDEVFEVDVFKARLAGLVIAEITPASRSGALALPDWIGPEVTEDPAFGDFVLARMESAPNTAIRAAAPE